MEFIGRIVKKQDSLGLRSFSGTVISYDASSDFFTVLYDHGHSEHLHLPDLLSLFQPNLGLRPLKRLTTDPPPSGTGTTTTTTTSTSSSSTSSSRLDTDLTNHLLNHTATLNSPLLYQTSDKIHGGFIPIGNINLNVALRQAVMDGNFKDALVSNGHPTKHLIGGLDLNSGLDLNQGLGGGGGRSSNPCYDSHVNGGSNLAMAGGIDLNLDATSELDETCDGFKREECSFDLNFGIDNEPKDIDSDTKGLSGHTTSTQLVTDSTQEVAVDVEVKVMDVDIANGGSQGFLFDISGLTSPRQVSTSTNSTFDGTSLVSVEITDGARLGDRTCTVLGSVLDHGYSSPQRDYLSEPADVLNEVEQTDLTKTSRRVSTRIRKRKVLEILNSPETGLRRSARRGSYQICTPDAFGAATVSDDLTSTPAVNVRITEEKHEHTAVLPPKLELPPSSGALMFEGISVVDLFSVYSCLRSFSTLLYLSPFELEDFIVALRSEAHNPLIDHIHVSLLQTLWKHLEHLSSEGSISATNCLRGLNWDFLDLMTWPIFLVEYLLLHSSGMQPCEVSRLRVFSIDYCKQPVSVKIEILRCLCDEVIEVEVIRSELSARSLAADSDTDFDRNVNIEPTRKRRGKKEISGRASLNLDVDDDTADKNSDECCLCKMDGSLICCDGCPAAYHSRCVGVECDLLPEGDWFCPECAIKRNKCGMRSRRSLRGAELLGIDPHGRVYFSCFDYLLVSDSHDNEVSYKYYHQSDLTHVIEVLKSLELSSSILKAIYKQWDGFVGCSGVTSYAGSQKFITQAEAFLRGQPAIPEDRKTLPYPAFADTCKSGNEKTIEKESTAGASAVFDALKIGKDSANGTETIYMSSEGSVENAVSLESERRENCLASTNSEKTEYASPHLAPLIANTQGDEQKKQRGSDYINFYRFGRVAALIVEDLLHRSVDKSNNTFGSVEDIACYQIKSISKTLVKFYWPNDKNRGFQKEKCGWCFPCRNPAEDFDCLINMYLGSTCEGAETEMSVIQSKNGNSYLKDFKCGLLLMEERLRGLLLGPWMNSHYTQTWRRSLMMSSDFASLKSLLLKLESSLHPRSISEEWFKYEDSTWLPGSASLVVTNSLPTSSKLSSSRKRAKCSTPESNHSASSSSGPVMSWWRGGRHSRRLFSCKIMPRSLVCKAARQGGRRKMPGVLYPENSDFARRSKAIAWQAAVESATGVAQLALQVRELDSYIRWDDIENINSICKWDKELRKALRAFKKVIIRRKRMEGDVAKYLLDFGKRRIIPEVVMKHGSLVEEGSSEKKRYWLNESFVPLHLLKNFEEKRVTRGSSKTSLGKDTGAGSAKKKLLQKSHLHHSEADVSRNKLPKEKGFDYLFSRAAETVYSYQCGHCKKVVLAREAVSCRTCEDFFHKRHAVKSGGTLTAECYYTCHRCRQGKPMKRMTVKGSKKGGGKLKGRVLKTSKLFISEDETGQQTPKKLKTTFGNQIRRGRKAAKKGKKCLVRLKTEDGEGGGGAAVVSLRRSTRKAVKYMPVQHKIPPPSTTPPRRGRGRPKGSKKKSSAPKKKEVISCHQKHRAKVFHSYWLNGLLLSRTADDERVVAFRNKSVICPSRETRVRRNRVKCNLCGEGAHTPTLNYISCETCTKWYHGDAFGLDPNKLRKVMGFRCHVCRGRSPPPGLSCGQLELHGGSQSSAAAGEEEEEEEEEETKNDSPFPAPSHLAALNSDEEANLKGKEDEDESHLMMKEETSVRELRVYRRAKQHSPVADRAMMGGDDDVQLYSPPSSSWFNTKKPSSSSSSNDDVEAERQQVAKKQKTSST